MEPVSLSQVIDAVGGRMIPAGESARAVTVAQIETDSRKVQEGDLFWALKGDNHDGHDFVEQAFAAGAAACVVSREDVAHFGTSVVVPDTRQALCEFAAWYRSRFDVLVVGITGSFGKTTTREMIHAVLGQNFTGIRSPKNFNNDVGVPLSLLTLDAEHEFAVFEVGASAVGEVRALCKFMQPEIGVITGIGPAHLVGFGSEDAIRRAKGELLESLPDDGLAVLAGDNPRVVEMATAARCPVVTVGEQPDNDIVATNIVASNSHVTFEVDGDTYVIPAAGRHFVNSALIAIAIAKHVGMESEEIAEGMLRFVPAPGRSHVKTLGSYTLIDDSYNANPASVAAACRMLGDWNSTRKRLLVIGDMLELGAESGRFHHEAGQIAAKAGIENIIAIGQFANDFTRGAIDAGMAPHRLAACDNWETLQLLLDCWLEPGDAVLVKGSRSMRMERVAEWIQAKLTNESATGSPDLGTPRLRRTA